MSGAPALSPLSLTAGPGERLAGSLVRAVRLFHGRQQTDFADAFRVSVRTVIRWEQRGIDPAKLPVDSGAADPDWRSKLLIWLLARYLASSSPDTRKKEG